MSDDFMNGMFDFNSDGKTDLGEEFIAYNIYEDVTKSNPNHHSFLTTPAKKRGIGLERWQIILIIFIVIYELLR